MTDSHAARSQAKRLLSMQGAESKGDAWRKEIYSTLLEVSRDQSHLESIITTVITQEIWAPAPAQVRVIAESVPFTSAWRPSGERCPLCQGQGRESFWALITTERWHDTGRVRQRRLERIPMRAGHEHLYLVERPEIEAQVDGISQCVQMVSGYCLCEAGIHMQEIQRAAQSRDGAK